MTERGVNALQKNTELQDRIASAMSERLVNIIIGLLGIALILGGILFSEPLGSAWAAVVLSIGASLIASAVVAYLSSIYLYHRAGGAEVANAWGLCSICENRAEMNLHVDDALEAAQEQLDIIAFGLKSFRETKRQLLAKKAAHGLSIRIITVDPDCALLERQDQTEEKAQGSTALSIRQLCEWVDELGQIPNAKVQIRFSDTLPTELYFRVDNRVYVGPYQCGRESQRAITMEYSGHGRGFAYYSEYFETLWNDGKFCAERTPLPT